MSDVRSQWVDRSGAGLRGRHVHGGAARALLRAGPTRSRGGRASPFGRGAEPSETVTYPAVTSGGVAPGPSLEGSHVGALPLERGDGRKPGLEPV